MNVRAKCCACPPVHVEIIQTAPKWWTEQQEMYQQGYFVRLGKAPPEPWKCFTDGTVLLIVDLLWDMKLVKQIQRESCNIQLIHDSNKSDVLFYSNIV